MGTWKISIQSNDTFQDIYTSFFDHYNKGVNPEKISELILNDFKQSFEDTEDGNNAYFALALAQWETKSLNSKIIEKVKTIIQTGEDIRNWESLGADKATLKKREKILTTFLAKLNLEKSKPKRRTKSKIDFQVIKLIDLRSPDGKKTFCLSESFRNGVYVHTQGTFYWKSSGSSILNYNNQNRNIRAKWLDHLTLEITHDKEIVFGRKDKTCFHGEFIFPDMGVEPIEIKTKLTAEKGIEFILPGNGGKIPYHSEEIKINYILI